MQSILDTLPPRGTGTIVHKRNVFLPRTELHKQCCLRIALRIESDEAGGNSALEIVPCFYGHSATWQDLLAALYFPHEAGAGTLGTDLETLSRTAHRNRRGFWTYEAFPVESGMEYLVWENDSSANHENVLAVGRVTSRLRFEPTGKMLDPNVIIPLADWYVFLNVVPHRPIDRILADYTDRSPREFDHEAELEWSCPGAEPWNSKP